MSLQDLVDRVVAVLSHAESLFASRSDGAAAARAGRTLAHAADASRGIAARAEELTGAGASAHRDILAGAADRLGQAAETDRLLIEQLRCAGRAHDAGASRSTQLREGAQELPDQLDTCTEIPAGELATLMALRGQVASMGRLIADHTSQAAQASDDITKLRYPP